MKQAIIISLLLLLIGCTSVNISDKEIVKPSTLQMTEVPTKEPIKEPDKPINTLNEESAISLIQSRLDSESLRISTISAIGKDNNDNLIIRQSSKATTVVMEWYHVNPATQEITCEIMKDYCLKQINDSKTAPIRKLSSKQIKAIEIAKKFAKEHYDQGYIEDITYVDFVQEEGNGQITVHIFNPGLGMIETIDWLTVNVDNNTVDSMFYKESDNTVSKVTYKK